MSGDNVIPLNPCASGPTRRISGTEAAMLRRFAGLRHPESVTRLWGADGDRVGEAGAYFVATDLHRRGLLLSCVTRQDQPDPISDRVWWITDAGRDALAAFDREARS